MIILYNCNSKLYTQMLQGQGFKMQVIVGQEKTQILTRNFSSSKKGWESLA